MYAVLFYGKGVIFYTYDGAAWQADYGISPPFLPALHGFEQIGIGAIRKLEIDAKRRIEIRQDLSHHGYPGITFFR